ncbi:MAG: type II toxin-antitoxin system RelE/ParE family toxin [Ignavibacteriae bacterium]|nr:type II toxin-antitoxin system RelE/ParE family toxin [Ignavibacteriota bacterium]
MSLDKTIARQVTKRIKWLSENIETLRQLSLKGELTGLYKLRVGDYRVIYQILFREQTIIIHQVGHRSEIYKR